jgi:hypothetical protein
MSRVSREKHRVYFLDEALQLLVQVLKSHEEESELRVSGYGDRKTAARYRDGKIIKFT